MANNKLYLFGGMNDGTELRTVSRFDASRKWSLCPEMPKKLSHFGCVSVGNKIFICGGHYGEGVSNELLLFDTANQKWESLQSMKYERYSCAVAALDRYLYVLDGHNNDNRMSVLERYSIEENEWEELSRPNGRAREGMGLVAANGFLYAIGGRDDESSLDITERYSPSSNEWTTLVSMNNPFPVSGCVVFNDRIYALGKGNFEEYRPEADKWTMLPAPDVTEYGRRLAVFDGKLLAIGGSEGKIEHFYGSKSVQYFDFGRGSWISMEDMDCGRCFHGVAVVN